MIAAHSDLRGPLEYSELQGYMGLPMDEIARRMFPMCLETEQQRLLEECCQVEHEVLEKRGGKLYPQVEETLAGPQPQVPLVYRQQLRGWVYPVLFPVHGPGKVFQGH